MRVSISQERFLDTFVPVIHPHAFQAWIVITKNTPACKLIPLFLLCNNSVTGEVFYNL